jgi:chromate reductase, NAD(P)H dehydrogenase (quinone)
MITIVSGTNRQDSYTLAVAEHYADALRELGIACQILDLRTLPRDFAFEDLYGQRSPAMSDIIHTFIENVDKFLFVIPEYNGSFPGVIKTFIDAVPPKLFRGKQAALVGVSSGQAGNLRGMEHLTGVLHYLKVFVHYNKLKLSAIDKVFADKKHITDERTAHFFADHVQLWQSW